MAELVKHLKGTQDAYNALSGGGGYSADTLYFTTEFSGGTELNTGRIYLGGTLVGKPSVWEELPEPETRDANYVYLSYGYDLNARRDGTRLDYAGETEYGGKTYHKFVYTYIDGESGERVTGSTEEYGYAMFASREFSKLAYPYADGIYTYGEDYAWALYGEFKDDAPTLYGFAEVPEDGHNTVVIERRSDTPSADPDSYIDLGLPSGTMWAKNNVGAATPEAYGDYFAWGETAPRGENWSADTPYDWAHAPFNNGSSTFNKAYFAANSGTWLNADGTLKPEYDAAHVRMGDGWRMPTLAQLDELTKATSHQTGTVEGVNGMFFTSKANGNSIFMPFAGRRGGSDVNNVGKNGYAWSSSLHAGDAVNSHYLDFGRYGQTSAYRYYRYYGHIVRGVC